MVQLRVHFFLCERGDSSAAFVLGVYMRHRVFAACPCLEPYKPIARYP